MEENIGITTSKKNDRFDMENGLRNAIEQENLLLHYQPKLSLISGKIVGVEALVRWDHPEKGTISPGEFIPIAEETGLILEIGEWVLRTACLQNKAWQDAGYTPVVMSVNLSVRQLYQPQIVEIVKRILNETGLAPKFLELEITESMVMDIEHCIQILREFNRLGVQISLDDFGTGYSSLQHLKELPINKLKIDQSFIRNCTVDKNDATIVKTIIAMVHQLELTVVAEGVESIEHMVFLQRNLCNEAQGYLFCKPIPPDEFIQEYKNIEQIIPQKGIPKELSNQKWLEEALHLAQQELEETIRQQQGMTFKYIKKDGNFIHTICDGELLHRMGLLPEQIVGRKLNDFLTPETSEGTAQVYQRAWEGEENITYEGEVNGIHTIISLRPIKRAGQVVEVIGSAVDITEMKQLKEALIQSESKYQIIAENMTDLVTVCDANGRITYASPSHMSILGFIPKVDGKEEYHWVHHDDIPHLQEQFMYMVSSKTPSQTEFRVKHVNGKWVEVEALFSPVIGKDGDVEKVVVVGRDISERKKMDVYIRKTEKISVVGQLAAGIAHEIRNPLTTVKGFLQLMQQDFKQDNYFEIMLSEINHIEKIIKEFLSFANPVVKKTLDTDIYKLLQQIITIMSTQSILKNVEIVQQVDQELPLIDCNEIQIKQVFINILQNALEAMKDGGVITIKATRDSLDRIKFCFTDTGCGISEDRMAYIFEPFYSTKEKGTGLGLNICYKIIQEHGGTINIESKVNYGTKVDVFLPIKQDPLNS
ncbi:EAL domain-containing protein [Lederbergia citri]|uniref:histidine kinase n=1 Tax=Lederbergia citri TaxID=2833580 RepID=A0A942TD25_9BACI|nr:EAL domain-containing protein [Lederbergia citri]MBS4195671.1 EAL domain-containing protein [Lederbergia citri]